MTLRAVFDWLSQPLEKQYTLGEALFGSDDFIGYSYNRGERLTERVITAGSLIAGGGMLLFGNPYGMMLLFYSKAFGALGAFVTAIATEVGKTRVTRGEALELERPRERRTILDSIENRSGLPKLKP